MGTPVKGGYGEISKSPKITLCEFIHTPYIFQMQVEITQNQVLHT